MPVIPRRIVAEISKRWSNGVASSQTPLLSEQFEIAISINAERGFELESWKLDRVYNQSALELNETIIAVFVERKAVGL